jgi:hypothetical protein
MARRRDGSTAARLDGLVIRRSMARQLPSSMAGRFDDWTVSGTTAQRLDGLPLNGSTVDGQWLNSLGGLTAVRIDS